jgi:predicted nucleic acid-binding protein
LISCGSVGSKSSSRILSSRRSRRGLSTIRPSKSFDEQPGCRSCPALPYPALPDAARACRLDPGESSVLALAYVDPGSEVVLDDLAARRAARRLGVPCLGTLGLVLTAKGLGVISEARPLVDQLRRDGLYLDDEFVDEVLRRIGE